MCRWTMTSLGAGGKAHALSRHGVALFSGGALRTETNADLPDFAPTIKAASSQRLREPH